MIDIYKLEILRAIIDFKPCGATHVDSIGDDFSCRYVKIEDGLVSSVNGKVLIKPVNDLRSIGDIEIILTFLNQ